MVFKKGHKAWNKGMREIESMKKAKSGDKNPRWKGGKRKHPLGYIQINSPNHPYKDRNGYVLEHRLVMEKHLGRVLLPTEVVHHINGDPKDNRIENLMLFANNGEHLSFHGRIRHG
jgi:hypothetical protein